MESGRFLFDPSASHGNMLFLGNRNPAFQGVRSMIGMEETSKRRLFFGSTEDLYDEEYYDEQLPEKKRRLTAEQVHLLENSFEAENKLEPERKTQLAKKLGLQPRQVAIWFQNRRARWKTKQLERDYDLLKSSYESLLSNHESIVKENEKLKSEVVSLTEKLQEKNTTMEPAPVQEENAFFTQTPHTGDAFPVQLNIKVEHHLSSGSAASAAVADEDGPQLVESCGSYFPTNDYPGHALPIPEGEGIQSEEDDGSDDGRSYFSNVFAAAGQQTQHNEETLGWWVWS